MAKTEALASAVDFIDMMAGLSEEHDLYTLRHQQPARVAAAQMCQHVLFTERLGDFSIAERYVVAWYVALLNHSPSLAGEYRRQLQHYSINDDVLLAVEFDRIADIASPRLREVLHFTRQLVLAPQLCKRSQLEALQQVGLSDADTVAVAQLVAYLSYQLRMVAGLQALKALEEQEQHG